MEQGSTFNLLAHSTKTFPPFVVLLGRRKTYEAFTETNILDADNGHLCATAELIRSEARKPKYGHSGRDISRGTNLLMLIPFLMFAELLLLSRTS